MKVILSKRGNDVWEYIQLSWFCIAVVIYFMFLDLL